MATLVGSGSGWLTTDDGDQLPYEMAISVEVEPGGVTKVRSVTIKATDGSSEVTSEVITDAIPNIPVLAQWLSDRLTNAWRQQNSVVERRLTTRLEGDSPEPDEAVEPVARTVPSRRSKSASPAGTDELEIVAQAYLDAQRLGLPVRDAVMNAMHVRKARADQLIAGARAQGLIGPATRGRPRGSKNRKQPVVEHESGQRL